jgi:hypothetical protein
LAGTFGDGTTVSTAAAVVAGAEVAPACVGVACIGVAAAATVGSDFVAATSACGCFESCEPIATTTIASTAAAAIPITTPRLRRSGSSGAKMLGLASEGTGSAATGALGS